MKRFRCCLIFSFIPFLPSLLSAQFPYSHGDPSPEEQLSLEYINRARLDPIAEGQRLVNAATFDHPDSQLNIVSAITFFGVNLVTLQNAFNEIPAAPPLAFNAQLIAAARAHSADMRDNNFQGHQGTDNTFHSDRMTAQGYNSNGSSENVFAFTEDVWQGHAGFNIDWGSGPDGMQDPPGHRNSIMNDFEGTALAGITLRETGIGYIADNTDDPNDNNPQDDGPFLLTQVFANQQDFFNETILDGPFVTGVAYEDLDGDNFYSIGEGFPGGLVFFYDDLDQLVEAAASSTSGGYAFP